MIYFYVQCDAAGRVIPKNGLTDDVGSSGRRVIHRQRTQSALSQPNEFNWTLLFYRDKKHKVRRRLIIALSVS